MAEDLDGDGDQDLLTYDKAKSQIVWFRNDGLGGFSGKIVASTSPYVITHMAVGDVDGDGLPDVVTNGGNSTSQVDFVLHQSAGAGALAGPVLVHGGGIQVSALHLVDLDLDGALDILTSVPYLGELVWRRGDGMGRFAPVSVLASSPPAWDAWGWLESIDTNGDGLPEVLAMDSNGRNVYLYPNSGGGLVGSPSLIQSVTGWSIEVASVLDLDGDLDEDLVLQSLPGIDWVENVTGSGLAGPVELLSISNKAAVATDLDKDGDTDVLAVTPDVAGAELVWVEKLGSGAFGSATSLLDDAWNAKLSCFADLDGDGVRDVLMTEEYNGRIWWIPVEPGGPAPDPELIAWAMEEADTQILADLDEDGDLDLVSKLKSALVWHRNDGSGTFDVPIGIIDGSEGSFSDGDAILIEDLDGDGHLDVVGVGPTTPFGPNGFVWLRGLGGGDFGPYQHLPVIPSNNPGTAVSAGDWDGDGDLDLFVGRTGPVEGLWASLGWMENVGGGFAGEQILWLAGESTSIAAGDLDGDGKDEIVFADGAGLYRAEPGGAIFADVTPLPTLGGLTDWVRLADLDNDGDLDVLACSGQSNVIAWYPNDGAGGFLQVVVVDASASHVNQVEAVDVNGDGAVDVVASLGASGGGQDGVVYYLNAGGSGPQGPRHVVMVTTGNSYVSSVAAGDLDGDGDVELVTADFLEDRVVSFDNLMGPFDCDGNGVDDHVEIAAGTAEDCNGNGVPDSCDLQLSSTDLNSNGILDACELTLLSVTPDHGAWYEGTSLTFAATDLDPALPTEVFLRSPTTPAAGDPPLVATVHSPTSATVLLPAGYASGAGPQDVVLRQGGKEGVVPGGWTSLPAVTPVLQGDAAAGGQLDIVVDAGAPGVVFIYDAAAPAAMPLPIAGIHHAIAIDWPTLKYQGVGPLQTAAAFSWIFAPGTLPPGMTVHYQGLVAEFPAAGQTLSFTDVVPLTIP